MTHRFDAIIIGAGQAGPPLADRLTRAKMTVAVVERNLFGGTCVNTGCTPTKTMVASAYAAHLARRGREYGVVLDGPVKIDMARVKARADAVAANSRTGVEKWLRGMPGCTVMQGHARFESADTVRVGEELLTAPRIFINVGGRAAVPDMPGVSEVDYLTNSTILGLDRVPEHLVVVGGSYIGLEFAQMHRRFGAEVTVVEKGPRLIAREDEDGFGGHPGHSRRGGRHGAHRRRVHRVPQRTRRERPYRSIARRESRRSSRRTCSSPSGAARTRTTSASIAPASPPTQRGFIAVDEGLATNVPGIWALGDCNGRGAFTHTAYNDFEIVAANLLDGGERRVSDRIPAYALYIDPPLGRVGMTVAQARATGRPLLIGERPMTRVSRRDREGRDERVHAGRRRRRDAQDPGRSDPRDWRRRGDPRHPRHDERRRILRHASARCADPSDRLRADPNHARRHAT